MSAWAGSSMDSIFNGPRLSTLEKEKKEATERKLKEQDQN